MAGLPVIVNGQPGSRLSVGDRGLAFGDGVFETIRYNRGQPVLLELHLQRMADGCQRLQIPWQADLVTSHLGQLLALAGETSSGVAKLIISRGETSRGYLAAAEVKPTTVASWHQLPSPNTLAEQQGIDLSILDFRLSANPALAGIKHLNRLEQVLAGLEIQRREAVEGLLLDRQGMVIEALSMNIFLARDGVWYTPLLDNCGIAGTVRQRLLQLLPQLGLPVQEANIHSDELPQFEQAFLVNSVKGLWPVASLAGRRLGIEQDQRKIQEHVMTEIEGSSR